MNSRKWAHPVIVGNVHMCPHCALIAVEHAFSEMMSDTISQPWRNVWAHISGIHLSILNHLTDEQKQLYAALLADEVLHAEKACEFRNVHGEGAVVDKVLDDPADDVPY